MNCLPPLLDSRLDACFPCHFVRRNKLSYLLCNYFHRIRDTFLLHFVIGISYLLKSGSSSDPDHLPDMLMPPSCFSFLRSESRHYIFYQLHNSSDSSTDLLHIHHQILNLNLQNGSS